MNLLQAEQAFKNELPHLYDANEAKSLFLLSISQLYGWDKSYFLLQQQEELTQAKVAELQKVLADLKTGKPIQYILGETEFFGLKFRVNPSVLIPRPETEELVKWILDNCKALQLKAPKILDIGTGSGCIPISLKKNLPEAQVCAIDISETALQTAKENAQINVVKIDFIQQDILADAIELDTFDIIVSNPPYVTLAEKQQMRPNVLEHEPHTALFVPDNDPLLFYRHIADLALRHLSPNGQLFFEINEHLGADTVDLLRNKGFETIELRKDLPGRERMLKCSRS